MDIFRNCTMKIKYMYTLFLSYSSLPLQQQRRVRVDDIEFNLTQHPLALFPHLEESLPPDVSCLYLSLYISQMIFPRILPWIKYLYFFSKVFEDVVEILDPEMNIDSETGDNDTQVNKIVHC